MPRKITAAERAEVKAFVRELYEQSGLGTQSKLAARMDVLPSQVSEWLNPEHDGLPDAVNFLNLIKVAGGLPRRVADGASSAEIEEVVRLQGEILRLLRRREDREAAQGPT